MREVGEYNTKVDIAKHFGVSRVTLDKWIMKWEASGLLGKCRQIIMVPRTEEIRAAEDAVLRAWPDILQEAVKIALGNGRSEKVAQEARAWLGEVVVVPRMEAQEESGAEELDYIEMMRDRLVGGFNPHQITSSDVEKKDET